MGTDVEPSTITNFNGFSAIAYMFGVTTASDGMVYEQLHDMRLYHGTYVDENGARAHGTFVFI